jgi:hypothetical protein
MSQESKYMELTPNHLYSVVDELEKSQEHLLIDMYRPHLEKTLETITTLEEEFDILKKYFNGRFIKIKDGIYRLATFPDNYTFNFEKNNAVLCELFIEHCNSKNSGVIRSNLLHRSKINSYGYQSFAPVYKKANPSSYISHRIIRNNIQNYKNRFKNFILKEIEKDRNKYCFYINYIIDIDNYPDKPPVIFFDDRKELLDGVQMIELENKINRLLEIRKGNVVLYHIEAFTSFYLSEIAITNETQTKSSNYLDRYNDKIEYPTLKLTHTPDEFVGDIYDIIKTMPRGTKISNVETILRQDLIWRFMKYKAMIKDKYPGKPGNWKMETGFHGTRKDRLSSIVRDGLMIPGNNNGLNAYTTGARYGNGIYLSPDPRFSMHYCRGDSCLLICAMIPGKQYTCSSNHWESELQKGYDSHISIDKTEMVLFDEAQILPCAIIHFTTTDMYQDWWDVYYNGVKKKLTYREQMKSMNKKEKTQFLESFGSSMLPYGFGRGKKCCFENLIFPDEMDDETNVEWYGDVDNEQYNLFQTSRFEDISETKANLS